jgi:hypothetical protein
MAAPSETYVDPSINANSGTGTIGDPYGDLQYALDTMTRDATNGDRINIKSGTAEVLTAAIDLTTYGTTGFGAPLILQGYTSSAGDGGIGEIDGNATYSIVSNSTYENMYFIDLKMGNCGSAADVIRIDRFCGVYDCEIHGCTGNGIAIQNGHSHVSGCHFHNIGAAGVLALRPNVAVVGCYFKNGTNKFTNAIQQDENADTMAIVNNIISLDSTSNGIICDQFGFGTVIGNSLFTTGTGGGIGCVGLGNGPIINNLIEGFDEGIDTSIAGGSNGVLGVVRQNAFYDCTTNITSGNEIAYAVDNESLGATPFAKSGSDTFANRFTYFAPVDTGNVYNGYPTGSNQTKGAVGQPVGGGGLFRVGLGGGISG